MPQMMPGMMPMNMGQMGMPMMPMQPPMGGSQENKREQ